MQPLIEILNKTTAFFKAKGIDNSKLTAELIIAHGLGCKRLDLYLRFEEMIEEPVLGRLREWVRRRGNREPLQYVLGEGAFMDLKLNVDKRVLVPRPETEELVQYVLDRKPQASRVLDLGTGSGAIALALAHYNKAAGVTAVDQSADALAVAQANAKKLGLDQRVHFLQSDWFSSVTGTFDVIVANPPYLTEGEWQSAAPEVKDHEPRTALVAENAGLHDLEHILKTAPAFLNADGLLALETGIAQHAQLEAIAKACGYSQMESLKDLSGRSRFFLVN